MDKTKELAIVRDLAKQYMEVALSPRYVRMRQRFRDTNDLKTVRPPVLIDEIPWQQMNYQGALDCICLDPELRDVEGCLRRALFRDKYFKCDNLMEPCWTVHKKYTSTGNGFSIREKTIEADRSDIVSHSYEDVLADEAALEAFHKPVITVYPEDDHRRLVHMQEIFDGVLPVVLRGHGVYYAPWDVIAMLRGVQPILLDMYDRPEYLHRIIRLFTEGMGAEMDQMAALGLYDAAEPSLHCTPAAVTLPASGTYCHSWFRTMAQMFSMVSPAAHDEFDVQYSVPLAKRCAFTYYGCCEPLHDRLDILRKYPNLRKVGCSPWADVAKMAEQLEGNYVLARKPNPANVALATDPEVVRREAVETLELCRRYGCPCEFVLKDISTVNNRPENLMLWAKTVSDVLDGYYGEA